MSSTAIPNAKVAAVFDSYPKALKHKLLELRRLILETAEETKGVGRIEEVLRWGEPAYLTIQPKTGTTIRIHSVRGSEDQYGMFFHCQTSLVSDFRQMYPDIFEYSGNRAIVFRLNDPVPADELRHCIALALRYHVDKH